MHLDTDTLLEQAMRDAISDGIKARFSAPYNNPLDKIVADSVATHAGAVGQLIADAINSAVNNSEFRNQIAVSIQTQLARTLVQRVGIELERQASQLASDPATRARITLAIDSIVKECVTASQENASD